MAFIVTEKAERPAGTKGQCFYCQRKIGQEHDPECVLINKMVRIKMIVEYDVPVPASWGAHQIEFHRNDGGWCSDNAIYELEELSDVDGCLCNATRFEFIKDTSGPFLSED